MYKKNTQNMQKEYIQYNFYFFLIYESLQYIKSRFNLYFDYIYFLLLCTPFVIDGQNL